MHRILVAVPSEIYTAVLKESLCNTYTVTCCHDGETALELLSETQPDGLVIDLMLPYKDGLTLLQETPFKPPVIIGTTAANTPYITQRALELGIDQLLICPKPSCVVTRLMDALANKVPQTPTIEQQTTDLLHLLQVPAQHSGYRALCAIIPMYLEDTAQSLTKALYPAVAKICNYQSAAATEQNIRRAITAAWKARNPIIWSRFFDVTRKRPTNWEFIARLAAELKCSGSA